MSGSKKPAITVIVPIMGPTGAGKSTFVNMLIGENKMAVGHQLTSCTSEPTQVKVPDLKVAGLEIEHDLFVLDTPGFDDTNEGDAVILTRIAEWLKKAYSNNTYILGGVLYLHDISQKRFTGTARKNLLMFNRMCGDVAMKSVVLCTTNWPSSVIERHPAEKQREDEFQAIHWKSMIENGSKVARFFRTQRSAQDVIAGAVEHMADIHRKVHAENQALVLQIQTELVTQKKIVPETKAAEELRYTLQEVIAMQKRMADLERSMADDGDSEAHARHAELKESLKKVSAQVKQLRIPFSRKLIRLFTTFK